MNKRIDFLAEDKEYRVNAGFPVKEDDADDVVFFIVKSMIIYTVRKRLPIKRVFVIVRDIMMKPVNFLRN